MQPHHEKETNHVPRTDQFREMPVSGHGDRNRWQVERQSGGILQTVGLREGSRSAFIHVVANHFGVATPLDQDALHCVLCVVRGLLGGTFGQLYNVPHIWRHHLLLSCWAKIRAGFLVLLRFWKHGDGVLFILCHQKKKKYIYIYIYICKM